ncbi:hypothetical protein ERJ75_000405700 [Trypanosoma vivax]|nr:hypothetical protein ERJ75_000405700 [Trypanosoma vivax]
MRRQGHSLGLVECHQQVQCKGFGSVEKRDGVEKRAKEVEVKAKEAIGEYNKLLNSIKTVDPGHITSNIEKAIKDAEDAIMRGNNASVNASAAEKSAKACWTTRLFLPIAHHSRIDSYFRILVLQTVNYTGTKEMVEKIKTDKCNNTEKYNVSARLSSYAEKLDEMRI